MSFLTPLFLVGLAALAVPVLIHLTQRERKSIVEFPSLMFVRRIPYQSVRRRRIRHWALLAMRAAAIALIVAAFARPFFRQSAIAAAAARLRRQFRHEPARDLDPLSVTQLTEIRRDSPLAPDVVAMIDRHLALVTLCSSGLDFRYRARRQVKKCAPLAAAVVQQFHAVSRLRIFESLLHWRKVGQACILWK